jgi:YrbI family 3-deoxy-D-manno-octulosonate 8-phosphate phosphatase
MPEESYYELDDPQDFLIIENLLKSKKINVISAHSDILRNIKLFLMDVDGVLTDAGMYYSEAGDELKKFNTRDGKGIELLRKHGIKTGIITSENTDIVARRANKLQIDYVSQGITDKLSCFRDLIREANVKPSEVVFIGDDVNDLDLLREVGFSAAPADAVTVIKNIVTVVCKQKGGKGCVREIAEIILESRGLVR